MSDWEKAGVLAINTEGLESERDVGLGEGSPCEVSVAWLAGEGSGTLETATGTGDGTLRGGGGEISGNTEMCGLSAGGLVVGGTLASAAGR